MTSRPEFISLIISTYNWPEALGAVLGALARQTETEFEIIIADDGSTQETGRIIKERQADLHVALKHVWQDDQGFRAAAARNLAISASRGDYLLFLDGDCIVLQDFVGSHRSLAEPGWFVAGNRVLLSDTFTKDVLLGIKSADQWSAGRIFRARINGEINRVLPFISFPDTVLRKIHPRRWQGAMTCNLGVWRGDLFNVNGFDESFVGWGHEDAEFVGRLINSGIYRKEGRFASPVMHLWHPVQDRQSEEKNLQRLNEHLAKRIVRAEKGVDRYRK